MSAIAIAVAGATPAEVMRGILAAEAVFDHAGVAPLDAARGAFDVEGWEVRGFMGETPPDRAFDLMEVWDRADAAAVAACCDGWPLDLKPETANLELTDDEA